MLGLVAFVCNWKRDLAPLLTDDKVDTQRREATCLRSQCFTGQSFREQKMLRKREILILGGEAECV